MYPKNSSNPPPIHAALTEALSGLPITSGITVYHTPGGGSQGPADNSPAHKGNGVWEYTPSQAETNYDSFSLGWYKPGVCYRVSWIHTETPPDGAGARSVTITVDDGSDPLDGALVRVSKGAETFLRTTDASGQCAFSLNDGTWDVTITLAGYDFEPDTLVVDGTETPTYSMTQVITPGASPGQVKGYLYCYDENGDLEEDVTIRIKITAVGSDTGYAYDDTIRRGVSDETGLVEFTGLFKGATYELRREYSENRVEVTIPADADDPYELISVIGSP